MRLGNIIGSAALLLALVAPASAQVDTAGRWERVDIRLDAMIATPGFLEPMLIPQLHFASPRVGYLLNADVYGRRSDVRVTTDGGETWRSDTTNLPWRMVDDEVGIARNGMVTRDGGATWQRVFPREDVTVVGVDAASRSRYAILYRDGARLRLGTTADGGATWSDLDGVLASVPDVDPEREETIEVIALRLVDTSTAVLFAILDPRTDGTEESRGFFMTTVDLATGEHAWRSLPGPSRIFAPADRSTAFTVTARRDEYDGTIGTLWRTDDAGRSWDSLVTTYESSGYDVNRLDPWPDFTTLQAISSRHLITRDAQSLDGGRSWQRWAHPFGTATIDRDLLPSGTGYTTPSFALDSLHRFVAGQYGLFARSSDGGMTWQRSAAFGFAHAVLAHGDRVIVARDYASVAHSSDGGRNWRDAGLDGNLPHGFRVMHTMVYPDTANPDEIIGAADFAPANGDRHLGIVRSTDGGGSWSEIGRLPDAYDYDHYRNMNVPVILDAARSATGDLVLVLSNSRGIAASTDGGRSWEERGSLRLVRAMAMSDDLRGIAVGNDTSSAMTGVAAWTSDGGRTWSMIEQEQVSGNGFHRFAVEAWSPSILEYIRFERVGRERDRKRVRSTDGGLTWTTTIGTTGPEGRHERAHWLDSATVYLTADTATISRSVGVSALFETLRFGTPADSSFAPFVNDIHHAAGISTDRRNLYLASRDNAVGRWRLGALPSPPPAGIDHASSNSSLTLVDDLLVVQLARIGSGVRVELFDAVGRRVATADADRGSELRLDLGGLTSGAYLLRIEHDGIATTRPITISR